MNKTRTIAIVAATAGLSEALKAVLSPRLKGATFVSVTKIADAPANAEIAGLGLPAFVPGTEARKVHSVGTRMLPAGSTQEDRAAQWQTIRDKNASPEAIIPQLGFVEECLVLPGRAYSALRTLVSDHRLAIAEAADEDKPEAYKAAFEALRDAVIPPAVAAQAEPEPEAVENETDVPL